MSDDHMNTDNPNDDLLERYLDGLLNPEQTDHFLDSVDEQVIFTEQALQGKIDSSLRRTQSPTEDEREAVTKRVAQMLADQEAIAENTTSNSTQEGLPDLQVAKAPIQAPIQSSMLSKSLNT